MSFASVKKSTKYIMYAGIIMTMKENNVRRTMGERIMKKMVIYHLFVLMIICCSCGRLSEESNAIAFNNYDRRIDQISDEDKTMLKANYIELELETKYVKEYPELNRRLEDINRKEEERINERIEGILKNTGESATWKIEPYEIRREFDSLCSDCHVFSYVVKDYEFAGGIHGYTSWEGYNINPVTGEDIRFQDIVKDVSNLPDIVINEMKSEYSDIREYYDNVPMAETRVKEYLSEYKLSNNAENLCWILVDGGIIFYFNDYELGCYSIGAKSIMIPFDKYTSVFCINCLADTNKIQNSNVIVKGTMAEGTSITKCDTDTIPEECIGSFAIVYDDGYAYLLDQRKKKISGPYLHISYDFDDEWIIACRYTGLNGLLGYLDREGCEITKPCYIRASKMKDRSAMVSEAAGEVYYINDSGDRISGIYQDGYPFENQGNYARVKDENGWGIINEQGVMVFGGADYIETLPEIDTLGSAIKQEHAVLFSLGIDDDFYIIKEYDQYKWISEVKYGTFAIVQNENGLFGIVNCQGDIVIEDRYVSINHEVLYDDSGWFGNYIRFELQEEDGTYSYQEIDFGDEFSRKFS